MIAEAETAAFRNVTGAFAGSMILAIALHAGVTEPEVYYRGKRAFSVRGKSVDGYVARARITYPYPLAAVLDATHDHNHLSRKTRISSAKT